MAGPFDTGREVREQHLKERTETVFSPELRLRPVDPPQDDPLELAVRKRTRKTYTVYLDGDLMERVKRIAKQRGVSASALIEACIKKTLSELE